MLEMESLYLQDKTCREEVISLKDLVSGGSGMLNCNYLVLSVKSNGERTCIQITTTDASPITYRAILPETHNLDFNSLSFVAQTKALPSI